MKPRIPPLNAVRFFETAARQGGFARAAEELNVTPAAVSHQVKLLEHWMKTPLFERAPNGVRLTDAGRDYAARIRDAFGRLVATSRAVREHHHQRVVTIDAQFSLASLWLLPRLARAPLADEGISIRLNAAEQRAPSKTQADISIYHARSDTPGFRQDALLTGHFAAYAAPAIALRLIQTPVPDWRADQLIHTTFEERGWHYPTWEHWFDASSMAMPKGSPAASFNLTLLSTQACVRGAGAALLLDRFCDVLEREGALVRLPGPAIVSPHPYCAFSRKNAGAAVVRVREWLLAEARNGLPASAPAFPDTSPDRPRPAVDRVPHRPQETAPHQGSRRTTR
jgi:DNA-binding transcriptional LysR family regulator